jgi:His-Xaa-Ser system radical SAM maturase HxsB
MAIKTKGNKSKIKQYNFSWRKIKDKVLLTNEFGHYIILKNEEFKSFIDGKLSNKSKTWEELQVRGFLNNYMDFGDLCQRWQKKNSFIYAGPGLHIFVVTLRCNHKCVYCQSGAVGKEKNNMDMSWDVAKKSVDMAFSSTNKNITIEFQGGEPLLNWDVVKKTIEYSRNKEKSGDKKLFLAIVTNFSKMDKEKADYLLKNEVSICTSLDGPEKLHNKNRIFHEGNSYKITKKWIKYFKDKHDAQKNEKYRIFKPSALLTVSRSSLNSFKEIIDEYVDSGFESLFIRALSPIGYARAAWKTIGYNSAEFLDFYRKSLDYIISLNKKGVKIKEKGAELLLRKILKAEDPGFLDLRCPCGATIGQVAYNYNGELYTCDEGRMVGWEGDRFFKIGDIEKSEYKDIINSSISKGCAISSNLDNQPMCNRCAYKPWCGVCPVINYELQKTPWGNMISNYRCELYMGIFDYIFELLTKEKESEILKSWVEE